MGCGRRVLGRRSYHRYRMHPVRNRASGADLMPVHSIEYLNKRRELKHAQSGGTNYAVREAARSADVARQVARGMSESELAVAEAYANAQAIAQELAAQLAAFRRQSGHSNVASNVASNVTCCPVCEARRAVGAARVARFRARKAAAMVDATVADAIPF